MATAAGDSMPPPPPPAPPVRKPISKTLIIVVVVIVVLAAILVGLYAAGVGPFAPATSSTTPSGSSYNVTFTETGLPLVDEWSVTLGGFTKTGTGSLVFSEKNGTYSFSIGAFSGYTSSPSSGSVAVSGAAISEPITWTVVPPGTYTVTFTESGLPSATSWSVTFAGNTMPSTGTSIVFSEKNGTYPFTAGLVSGYTPSPASGSVTVSGPGSSQAITYSPSTSSPGQTSYSEALPVAVAKADAEASGFVPVFADGDSVSAAYTNSSPVQINASCPLTGGISKWGTLPAFTGDYSNGYATTWLWYFYSGTGPSLMIITTQGSTATFVGTATGSKCVPSDFSYITPLSTTGIIDSPTVATDLSSVDSSYVTANPTASAGWGLYGGFTIGPIHSTGYWYVLFTTCVPGSGTGTGNNFTAEVNASSGAVISHSAVDGATCGKTAFRPGPGGGYLLESAVSSNMSQLRRT